jgi:hypothetical protein
MNLRWFSLGFLFMAGCSNLPSPKAQLVDSSGEVGPKIYPEKSLDIHKDDGDTGGWGADFGLSIVLVSQNDSGTTYKAVSTWENQDLGLSVTIPNKENKDGFGHSVEIKSIGAESDRLLCFMAKMYGQKLDSPYHFKKSASVDFINLQTFALSVAGKRDTTTDKKEYKLFFPLKDDDAELYLNIDDQKKRLEIEEKDPEFRSDIIKCLRQ